MDWFYGLSPVYQALVATCGTWFMAVGRRVAPGV